jgi:hypothetical protein
MMAASGRAGRKENCVRACGGKRWDGCVVGGAVGVGTGGKEMPTAKKALLLMDRIRSILFHFRTLQLRNGCVRGTTIKVKGQCTRVLGCSGRGGVAGRGMGVEAGGADGAGAARRGGGGASGLGCESGVRK